MGLPMAGHLLAAGHELAVWARRPEAAAPLVEAGATLCASPAQLAARSEVVISIVTGSADVEQLAFGPGGLVEGFAPGGIHVDMSTIAPGMARRLAARYAERGIGWLDAPVSGGGQVAKACNQMLMVNAIQAAAEAMRLAAAHGLDLLRVREALAGGSAGSKVLDVMGGRMARRDFAAGIQARLHHKDFAMLMDEARQLGAPLPVATQTWQQLNALMALGGGRMDTSSLLKVLEAPVEKMQ